MYAMRFAACLAMLLASSAIAAPTTEPVFTSTGEGSGASIDGRTIHLLAGGEKEVNQIAIPATTTERPRWVEIRADLKLDPGGEGLGLLLLNADLAGRDAPVTPLELPEEPNHADAIGIGFDSRDPASSDAFDADGNLYDRPQREVSVHVDGREILNRQSADFATGETVPLLIRLDFVVGGAKLTVRIGDASVYENEFLPSVRPFVPRLVIGARAGGKVKLDLTNLELTTGPAAGDAFPSPRRVVLFDKSVVSVATSREPNAVIGFGELPQDVGRVICTLKLATPPGAVMDKWDRRGALYLYTPDNQRYEILRFKTPFLREWEWQADVTDFLPLLNGQQKFGMFVDTWRDGFAMSATLDFYPGKPERLPIKVVNLWQGEPIIGDPKMSAQKFFDEKTVPIPPTATGAKVRMVVSGHGQFPNSKNAGEFLGLNRSLWVNGREFQNLLWKTDNYLNPCRPQKGTWKYDRAGWGPGSLTPAWSIDIDPIVKQSPKELTLDYAIMDEYVNEHIGKGDPPTHWVDGQVIFYSDGPPAKPATTRPATQPARTSP
jgi:hypothetical protein